MGAGGHKKPKSYAELNTLALGGKDHSKAGGGALVGLIALAFGDLSAGIVADAPERLTASFVTAIIAGGFFLIRAYVGYANATTELTQLTDDQKKLSPITWSAASRIDQSNRGATERGVLEYHRGRLALAFAITATVVGVILYLVAAWCTWDSSPAPEAVPVAPVTCVVCTTVLPTPPASSATSGPRSTTVSPPDRSSENQDYGETKELG